MGHTIPDECPYGCTRMHRNAIVTSRSLQGGSVKKKSKRKKSSCLKPDTDNLIFSFSISFENFVAEKFLLLPQYHVNTSI